MWELLWIFRWSLKRDKDREPQDSLDPNTEMCLSSIKSQKVLEEAGRDIRTTVHMACWWKKLLSRRRGVGLQGSWQWKP